MTVLWQQNGWKLIIENGELMYIFGSISDPALTLAKIAPKKQTIHLSNAVNPNYVQISQAYLL